ncbi:MAG: DUF885 domain-containing protein [Actinomycetia bacterium]|nr:DUF885 domain-containing protein [Actinomycetes bacterium]
MSTDTSRPVSAVDDIANDYFDALVEQSPTTATYLGIPTRQDELDDVSPAGLEAQAALHRETLERLADATPVDAVDEVTVAAMRERLGLYVELHESGEEQRSLNVIASPLQMFREIFDLMPMATDEDWATIGRRMGAVPGALENWKESLEDSAAKGHVAAQRQVEACIQQCADLVADDGYFTGLLARARTDKGDLDDSTRDVLKDGVEKAADAYRTLGEMLRERILPFAPEADAVGRERYALHSRNFLGATVDLEETYAWGQEELARIVAEMAATADRIKPGASVKEAIAALDSDPRYQLHGTDALQAWMQGKADQVIAEFADVHFDIPEPVRRIECMIAPTQTGGIYYTGPSDDFSRPGRMWWSVPKGVTEFSTWRELTTVYHEGVPGHHLQIAQTTYRKELLNAWRRNMCFTSGHGEGWALYSERLMAELGYLDDPGDYMGMLDGQSLRAARVVLDIGLHCGFEAPAELGGGEWTYDKAWAFLTEHANMDESFLRFELDRYLGWPGQAPSYKVGERLWMQLRDETAQREGEAFDLKAFHRRALDIGSVGLDVLREAVLR